MLAVANTSLSLTVGGTSSIPVLHVANANATAGGSPCALHVKPTLRNATAYQLGYMYVSFSVGFAILKPGEENDWSMLNAGPTAGGVAELEMGVMACVEAWNAPRVCVALPK